MSKKQRKNYQDVKHEFEKRNYILLTKEDKYKNNKETKLKYICPKGHEGLITLNNFLKIQYCPVCRKKLIYEKIKKEFERRKYILLTEEKDYKNSKQKLIYICSRWHEGSISWNDFQQGNNCPICCKELRCEKMTGNDNPNYKYSKQKIFEIRIDIEKEDLTQKEMSKKHGVSKSTISRIKRGEIK